MATEAHCVYCFESLYASFEHSKPPSLAHVEELWEEYTAKEGTPADDDDDADAREEEDGDGQPPRKKKSLLTGLKARVGGSPSSDSSTSLQSKASGSSNASSAHPRETSASSAGASDADLARKTLSPSPMFVTWNKTGSSGSKKLRGCIGTFEALEIEAGLHQYALTSAFEDTRFNPITSRELPSLSAEVTLLTDFEPAPDPMAWTIGQHGIRIAFSAGGRRYGATYLPSVAEEQGWSKEEALVSLMRKAGWGGRAADWRAVADLRVTRYQGRKVGVSHARWRAWRAWAERRGSV